MKYLRKKVLLAVAAAAVLAQPAFAQEPIKIGVVTPMSGLYAANGRQVVNGIKTFMLEHGDTVAGRKITVLLRDNAGPNPEATMRLTQELISRDNVDVLAGYVHTPDALAAAQISTRAKKPMFLAVAATSSITAKAPYVIRASYTVSQASLPMGQWAANNGINKAFVMAADYGPGHDATKYFKKGFEESGGQIVDELFVPPNNREFGPYVQRIKDAKPDAVFVFMPNGEPTVAFMKEYVNRGLAQAGIKILASEGWIDDESLGLMGESAIGIVNTGIYTTSHDSALNKKFLDAYKKVDAQVPPNFMAVGAYDSMRIIYDSIEKQNGQLDGEILLNQAKGMEFESPRGMLLIDKETRDATQNVYVRRVEKQNGKLVNIEFDKFSMVPDPAN